MNSTDFSNTAATWETLIFGTYDRETVQRAVADDYWQYVRGSMHGRSMADRYLMLQKYLHHCGYSEMAKVRVTNYVYALKRGGMWK